MNFIAVQPFADEMEALNHMSSCSRMQFCRFCSKKQAPSMVICSFFRMESRILLFAVGMEAVAYLLGQMP